MFIADVWLHSWRGKKDCNERITIIFFSSGTKIPGSAQAWEFILNYYFNINKQTKKKRRQDGILGIASNSE